MTCMAYLPAYIYDKKSTIHGSVNIPYMDPMGTVLGIFFDTFSVLRKHLRKPNFQSMLHINMPGNHGIRELLPRFLFFQSLASWW